MIPLSYTIPPLSTSIDFSENCLPLGFVQGIEIKAKVFEKFVSKKVKIFIEKCSDIKNQEIAEEDIIWPLQQRSVEKLLLEMCPTIFAEPSVHPPLL